MTAEAAAYAAAAAMVVAVAKRRVNAQTISETITHVCVWGGPSAVHCLKWPEIADQAGSAATFTNTPFILLCSFHNFSNTPC